MDYDVLIIGGGFYGTCLSLLYSSYYNKVGLVEENSQLMTKSSYANQARVHGGYHYPRCLVTAKRSLDNHQIFCDHFKEAIVDDFTNLYAVAKANSQLSARQFHSFFQHLGAPITEVKDKYPSMFDYNHIDSVFEVQESVFDTVIVKDMLLKVMEDIANLDVSLNSSVVGLRQAGDHFEVSVADGTTLKATKVINCCYSAVNKTNSMLQLPIIPLSHEWTELALVEPPTSLGHHSITLMDGNFFSLMPFPAKNCYSLSHVLYTPHQKWGESEIYQAPPSPPTQSNYLPMVRAIERYYPEIQHTNYLKSLYVTKTKLPTNKENDGRPIFLSQHHGVQNYHVIIGGKIDNIYDIASVLVKTDLPQASAGQRNAFTDSLLRSI